MALVRAEREKALAAGRDPRPSPIARVLSAQLGRKISAGYIAVTLSRICRPDGAPRAEGHKSNYAAAEKLYVLSPFSEAARVGRTIFPSTVIPASASPGLFISGKNSPKLGDRIVKGWWKGLPIFSFTLEERATCPRSCHFWLTCMGNGMNQARRHEATGLLPLFIRRELGMLGPAAIRLHQLGDFFSVDYVWAWGRFLDEFPDIRIFGYSARSPGTKIGQAVHSLAAERWDRFAIRRSVPESKAAARTAVAVIDPENPPPGVIMCPAQSGKTANCGTCGLCWTTDSPIGFAIHGRAKHGARVP